MSKIMDLQGIMVSGARVARSPRRLLRLHYSKIFSALHQTIEISDFSILKRAFGISTADCQALENDLLNDTKFQNHLADRYQEIRRTPCTVFALDGAGDHNPAGRLLYYCVRLHQPETAIDTGVLDGFSTACILKGLKDNDKGNLYSIDLPAYEAVSGSSNMMNFGKLPPGHEPGWIIPEELRSRWELQKGSSRDLLLPLLAKLETLDLFYHDSLHTNEHMLWEYNTVWPFLKDKGVLVSDDIFWNPAFWTFTRKVGTDRLIKRGVGVTRKGHSFSED